MYSGVVAHINPIKSENGSRLFRIDLPFPNPVAAVAAQGHQVLCSFDWHRSFQRICGLPEICPPQSALLLTLKVSLA